MGRVAMQRREAIVSVPQCRDCCTRTPDVGDDLLCVSCHNRHVLREALRTSGELLPELRRIAGERYMANIMRELKRAAMVYDADTPKRYALVAWYTVAECIAQNLPATRISAEMIRAAQLTYAAAK